MSNLKGARAIPVMFHLCCSVLRCGAAGGGRSPAPRSRAAAGQSAALGSLGDLSRENLAPAACWTLSWATAISQPSLCPSNSASFGTLLHETSAFPRQAQQTLHPCPRCWIQYLVLRDKRERRNKREMLTPSQIWVCYLIATLNVFI